jgi:hypothetical protein
MSDCSNCNKVVEVTPTSHVCNMGQKKYVISDYPLQGINCATWQQCKSTMMQNKQGRKDPFLSWISRNNKAMSSGPVVDEAERKILEAYERNMGTEEKETPCYSTSVYSSPIQDQQEESSGGSEINLKYASGWIVAAVFGGLLLSIWLLGLIK